MWRHWRLIAGVAASILGAAEGSAQAPQGLDKLSHILVLYLENRSFDNLFGEFPYANGIARAGDAALQRRRDGTAYDVLPIAKGPFRSDENAPDISSIPDLENFPNRPFAIDAVAAGITLDVHTRDLRHSFYAHRSQIHDGRNDWFALFTDAGALTMGYYSKAAMEETNLWRLARNYKLLDNFFQGAFGGSFLNHQWLICACAPAWTDPPDEYRSTLDPEGHPLRDLSVTAKQHGDYAVNTVQSVLLNDGAHGARLLPAQSAPTIGDRLTAKGVEWAWYSGGWNLAIKDERTPVEKLAFDKMRFQWHHQPFAYFARFDPKHQSGRSERAARLKDARELARDIASGRLPPVAFYKPEGARNQHPGYSNILAADREVGRLFELLQSSPMRDSYALIITYDEFGGFFDHVTPPRKPEAGARADFFGPGSRVPTVIVSPFVQNKVDSAEYETTSILKLIADRHRLDPLPSPRFQAVESLARAFDFDP
jgi:phospholipase C